MSRVITSIHFDLKFNVSVTPPAIRVAFTDVDATGHESENVPTSIHDAAAQKVWDDVHAGVPVLDALNAAIDVQAAAVTEPGAVGARVAAANEADQRMRRAQEAQAASEKIAAEADRRAQEAQAARIEATTAKAAVEAEHAAIADQIAAKRAELAQLAAEAAAAATAAEPAPAKEAAAS